MGSRIQGGNGFADSFCGKTCAGECSRGRQQLTCCGTCSSTGSERLGEAEPDRDRGDSEPSRVMTTLSPPRRFAMAPRHRTAADNQNVVSFSPPACQTPILMSDPVSSIPFVASSVSRQCHNTCVRVIQGGESRVSYCTRT